MSYRLLSLPLAFLSVFAACSEDTPSIDSPDSGATSSSGGGASSSGQLSDSGGASSSGGALPDAAVGSDTVAGRIVNQSGLAVAGIVVQIQGQSATTDNAGRFEIAGIATPYDLTLIVPSGSSPTAGGPATAQHFVSVRELAPRLVVAARDGASNQATVTASLPAPPAPGSGEPPTLKTFRKTLAAVGTSLIEGQGSYTDFGFTPRWSTSEATTDLHALVVDYRAFFDGDTGREDLPVEFLSIGRADALGLTPGTSRRVEPDLRPLGIRSVSITQTEPPGFRLQHGYGVSIAVSPGSSVRFTLQDPPSPYGVPNSTQVKIPVDASLGSIDYFATAISTAQGITVSGFEPIAPDQTSLLFLFTVAPALTEPAPDATGFGFGSTVSWPSAGSTCLYEASVSAGAAGSPALVTVTTEATSVVIPDLSSVGIALAAGQPHRVAVTARCDAAPFPIDDRVRADRRERRTSTSAVQVTAR